MSKVWIVTSQMFFLHDKTPKFKNKVFSNEKAARHYLENFVGYNSILQEQEIDSFDETAENYYYLTAKNYVLDDVVVNSINEVDGALFYTVAEQLHLTDFITCSLNLVYDDCGILGEDIISYNVYLKANSYKKALEFGKQLIEDFRKTKGEK